MTKIISVIGIGEENPALLTSKALARIESADIIFGATRHLQKIKCNAQKTQWLSPFEENFDRIKKNRNKKIVILATGDPLWFGIGASLLRHFDTKELEFIAHTASFNLACSALGWPLHNCYCLSAHGRTLDEFKALLQPNQRYLLLTSDAHSIFAIDNELIKQNGIDSNVIALECLGGDEERIHHFKAGAIAEDFNANFYILAIETTAQTAINNMLTAGLDDALFSSDGQLTKQWMRAISLARLKPRQSEVLWDIGAGSGSISIEWTRLSHGSAYAIEIKKERITNIVENKDNLGGNIHIIEGDIDDASIFEGLPQPNAIFIGGGLSDIHQIEFFIGNLHPHGRLVINSVTQKGEIILHQAFDEIGGNLERFGMEHLSEIGEQHAFRPAMRITQWWYQRG